MKKFSFLTKSRWVVTIIVLFTLCVNQAWGGHTIVKAGDMVSGEKYIITAVYNGTTYYLAPGSFDYGAGAATAYTTSLTEAAAWTFTKSSSSWTITTTSGNTTYYLNNKNANNGVRSSANSQTWTVAATTSGASTVYITGGNSRKLALYNDVNWRCYSSASGVQTITLYKVSGSSCDKKVTLTKGSASNGSFTLDKADGDHDNCDANFVVTVSGITPNSGYACTGVTATGGNNSVSGPDGSGNYTVTYTKGNNITSTITANFALKCATPTFSPEAGTYNNNQSVTITSTAGSTIYYTTDGSTPTTSSAVYSSAISVSSDNTTIKALAVKAGYTNSDVGSATYRLTCATPTFAPVAGTYQTAQSVTLSSTTTSAVIHYTTDGSTPTASSPTASGAITVSADMTIKAIATRTNYGNSAEASASYKIRDCDWFESFDNANGSGGNDGVWSGSIGSNAFTPDKTGWTFSTTNCGASKCIKLGTGSAAGSAQTAALTGMRGTISVKFSAAGFGTDGDSDGKGHYTHNLTISSTNGTPSPSSVTITNQTWNDYEVEISGVTADAQITIASSGSSRRFFLDEVCIKNSGVQYSVTYDDNDATNGSVPTDGNKYDRNGSATVLGNTGNLVKTGWTFAGWNTAADGSGTTYAAGSTYSNITSNVTLYAKWTCTVTWSVNENTSACSPETVTYDPDGCKVTTVPRPDPEDYCGDKFVGWYTADYDDDDTAPTGTFKNVDDSPNITGDRTFYAVFADFVAE